MTDKTELKRVAEEVISAAELYAADRCNDYLAASWATADEVFRGIASPAAVLTLFSENERVKARLCVCRDCGGQGEVYSGRSTYQGYNQPPEPDMDVCGTCGGDGVLGPVEDFEALAAERDRLKDAIATPESVFINLKAGKIPKPSLRSMIDLYGEVINGEDAQLLEIAKLRAERDQLKAENEALRDDTEQNQYDDNAWRNSEESVWIEVFNSEGDDPFISAITGQITLEQLTLIQAEILEYREDYFEKGSGLYVFRCRHCQAHYDNVGMTEPAHWETDFELYSPFPWEEEAAAIGEGEQS